MAISFQYQIDLITYPRESWGYRRDNFYFLPDLTSRGATIFQDKVTGGQKVCEGDFALVKNHPRDADRVTFVSIDSLTSRNEVVELTNHEKFSFGQLKKVAGKLQVEPANYEEMVLNDGTRPSGSLSMVPVGGDLDRSIIFRQRFNFDGYPPTIIPIQIRRHWISSHVQHEHRDLSISIRRELLWDETNRVYFLSNQPQSKSPPESDQVKEGDFVLGKREGCERCEAVVPANPDSIKYLAWRGIAFSWDGQTWDDRHDELVLGSYDPTGRRVVPAKYVEFQSDSKQHFRGQSVALITENGKTFVEAHAECFGFASPLETITLQFGDI